MEIIEIVFKLLTLVSLLFGIFGIKSVRDLKKYRSEERDLYRRAMRKIVDDLERKAGNTEPKDYVTLDYRSPGGHVIHVPLFQNEPMQVMPGVTMMLMRRMPDVTICSLSCPMSQGLPSHSHMRVERIVVLAGMLDELDGEGNVVRTYHQGETWEIPSGTEHRCTFRNALATLSYVPTLPTGEDQPAELTHAFETMSGAQTTDKPCSSN